MHPETQQTQNTSTAASDAMIEQLAAQVQANQNPQVTTHGAQTPASHGSGAEGRSEQNNNQPQPSSIPEPETSRDQEMHVGPQLDPTAAPQSLSNQNTQVQPIESAPQDVYDRNMPEMPDPARASDLSIGEARALQRECRNGTRRCLHHASENGVLQHTSNRSSQTMAAESQSDGIDAGCEAEVDESEDWGGLWKSGPRQAAVEGSVFS